MFYLKMSYLNFKKRMVIDSRYILQLLNQKNQLKDGVREELMMKWSKLILSLQRC